MSTCSTCQGLVLIENCSVALIDPKNDRINFVASVGYKWNEVQNIGQSQISYFCYLSGGGRGAQSSPHATSLKSLFAVFRNKVKNEQS